MDLSQLESEIPYDTARAAHYGTSFDPEKRATQEQEEYARILRADWEMFAADATTPEKLATLEAEFPRYHAGYREHTLALLAAESRIVSTMIAGRSNFPFQRMQKRNATADKRRTELIEFRNRALAAIRKAMHPEERPIMTGDANASDRLADKLAALEAKQEQMKAANAAIRKHAKAGADAQIAALVALGIPPGVAADLLKPDDCGRVGFADFEIKNNSANIRRLRARAEAVSAAKATPDEEIVGEHARMVVSPGENRVRLYFPGKPSVEVRSTLKGAGFRWAPSEGAWQAYVNHNSITTARTVAGIKTEATAA